MSFQTGLSGLSASSRSLDVIGHNIANANTTGMKSSRTEFSAVYASMLGFGGANNNGIGVQVANVAQMFTQGSLSTTGNALDVGINGSGFFQLTQPDGTLAYTRDGAFKLEKDGDIVTNTGANVMGFPTDTTGVPISSSIQALTLPTAAPIEAKATTKITAELNLDARTKVATNVSPPTPITTYSTTLTTFDSQGVEIPTSVYFVKVGPDPTAVPAVTTDAWDVFDASTLAAGTAALAINGPIGYANATNPALDIKNTELNLSNTVLSATNDATNIANDATNTENAQTNADNAADNLANITTPVPGYVNKPTNLPTNLPTLANGGLPVYPTYLADGLSTFTPPAAGTVIPKIPPAAAMGPSGALFRMIFDTTGKLKETLVPVVTPAVPPAVATVSYTPTSTPLTLDLSLTSPNPAIGTFASTMDVSNITQYGTAFAVSDLTQDGYTAGELVGITIGEDGVVSARYSNGETQAAGQVSLADFRNVQGLAPLGGNAWAETFASGQPLMGTPGQGKFGALRAGALEESNVDLTKELVDMMTAQRAYQANAQTIKTQDQIMSTLVNLK